MKSLFLISTLLTSIAFVGCNTWKECDCSSEKVCLTVDNLSGQTASRVWILHKNGSVGSNQLANGSRTCLSFEGAGESSFYLSAILSNGKKVQSRLEYSEGGYKFLATIEKDTINIRDNSSY